MFISAQDRYNQFIETLKSLEYPEDTKENLNKTIMVYNKQQSIAKQIKSMFEKITGYKAEFVDVDTLPVTITLDMQIDYLTIQLSNNIDDWNFDTQLAIDDSLEEHFA